MNRRRLLAGLALAPFAGLLGRLSPERACADDASGTGAAGKQVDYLFVQNAKSAKLKDGVLTLKDVNAQTIYFSDRPERIVGHASTEDFVTNWGHGGSDSFAADPPNAALSILHGGKAEDVIVVLRKPRLEQGALIYDVDVLDGDADAAGEGASLFIDVIGHPLTPVSVAGVARRSRRRAALAN